MPITQKGNLHSEMYGSLCTDDETMNVMVFLRTVCWILWSATCTLMTTEQAQTTGAVLNNNRKNYILCGQVYHTYRCKNFKSKVTI